MTVLPAHVFTDEWYARHAELLCSSYLKLLGKPLLAAPVAQPLEALLDAPFAVLSHGTGEDPLFNFANRTALDLFEMDWELLTATPSRKSAEPLHREERRRLLDSVSTRGYINNYRGVRISARGRRFMIEQAVVWNLMDADGNYRGQAASFAHWTWL